MATGAPGLSWEVPVSAFLHAAALAGVVLFGQCGGGSQEPLFTPEEVMTVELAGPMKQTTALPQRASRTPDPVAGTPEPTTPPPPPDRSELAFKTPEAPKPTGDPKEDTRRQELINELRRQAALKDLSAPLGTVDRAATSAEGTSTEAGSGSGAPTDPELARWAEKAKQLISANWHPLQTLCQQKGSLQVDIHVSVNAAGEQLDTPTTKKTSGNVSFDESARRAAEMTTRLPPVPAKFPNGLGINLTFNCKDAT